MFKKKDQVCLTIRNIPLHKCNIIKLLRKCLNDSFCMFQLLKYSCRKIIIAFGGCINIRNGQCTQVVGWAFSTLVRKREMTFPGSGAPNTELPATIQLAPASAAASIVDGPNPPSTSISSVGYFCLSARTYPQNYH